MPNDLPDYTKKIAISVVVGYDSVPVSQTSETPVVELDRYSGSAVTYQSVVSWTVAVGKGGVLKEVSMESDNYAKTLFRLEIGGTAYFTDKTVIAPLTIPFADVSLAEGVVVELQAKSSDGTALNVDGMISGKEIG
jgi:hypothetical protein